MAAELKYFGIWLKIADFESNLIIKQGRNLLCIIRIQGHALTGLVFLLYFGLYKFLISRFTASNFSFRFFLLSAMISSCVLGFTGLAIVRMSMIFFLSMNQPSVYPVIMMFKFFPFHYP
jgi:hypothetical protein